MFPESLAKGKRGHTSASYTEILEYSAQFQSIETLREKLVEREIANSENEESVHGLINFLIEAFVLSPDPYQAVYVFEGKKKQVSYGKLMELKTVRNAIVHQGGSFSEDDRALSAAVRGLDGGIQIDDEYDLESHCVLLAIASAIDEAIKRKSRD